MLDKVFLHLFLSTLSEHLLGSRKIGRYLV